MEALPLKRKQEVPGPTSIAREKQKANRSSADGRVRRQSLQGMCSVLCTDVCVHVSVCLSHRSPVRAAIPSILPDPDFLAAPGMWVHQQWVRPSASWGRSQHHLGHRLEVARRCHIQTPVTTPTPNCACVCERGQWSQAGPRRQVPAITVITATLSPCHSVGFLSGHRPPPLSIGPALPCLTDGWNT